MKTNKETMDRNRLTKKIRSCLKIDENAGAIVDNLVDNLVFQFMTLSRVREEMRIEGICVEFEQGKQSMTIQHPLIKTYNDFIKNMNTTVKTLIDITGNNQSNKNMTPDEKEFIDFLKGKKSK